MPLLCLAALSTAQALSTDREQPIELEADRGWLNQHARSSVYEGNVVLTQGSLRLEGDRLEIYYTEDRRLRLAVIEGRPARGRQLPAVGAEAHEAEALRLEYHAIEGRILLIGTAVVRQPLATIEADQIEYDTIKSAIVARSKTPTGQDGRSGPAEGKRDEGRVKLTILPDADTFSR